MARPRAASPLPGALGISRTEIEAAGFNYSDLDRMLSQYNPESLTHGYNNIDGEEVFFIANPGLGLWAHRSRI